MVPSGGVCELDAGEGRFSSAVTAFGKDARDLLKSRDLSEAYWREGYSARVKRDLCREETAVAENALEIGDLHPYLNSVGSRASPAQPDLPRMFHKSEQPEPGGGPAAGRPRASELVPLFVEDHGSQGRQENEWPTDSVPPPRLATAPEGSPSPMMRAAEHRISSPQGSEHMRPDQLHRWVACKERIATCHECLDRWPSRVEQPLGVNEVPNPSRDVSILFVGVAPLLTWARRR